MPLCVPVFPSHQDDPIPLVSLGDHIAQATLWFVPMTYSVTDTQPERMARLRYHHLPD